MRNGGIPPGRECRIIDMADHARRANFSAQSNDSALDEDDPLAALARLMDEETPEPENRSHPVVTPVLPDPPAPEPEPMAELSDSADGDDLEASLLAELAGEAPPEEIVPAAEEAAQQDTAELEEPLPAEEAAAPDTSIEDELQALLQTNEPVASVAEALGEVEPSVEAISEVEPEAAYEPELEPVAVDAAVDESFEITTLEDDLDHQQDVFVEAEAAPAEQAVSEPVQEAAEAESDDAFLGDDFEDIFAVEFDSVVEEDPTITADSDQPVAQEPVVERSRVTPSLAGAGIAALTGAAAQASSADEDAVSDGIAEPQVAQSDDSALDELEAIMAGKSASADDMPVVDTRQLGLAEPSVADFEVPDVPDAEPDMTGIATATFDTDELDVEFDLDKAESDAAIGSVAGLSDAFDDNAFESELAKDIEFADHDRSSDVVVDDDLFDEDDAVGDEDYADEPPKKRGFMVAAIAAGVAIAGTIGILTFAGGGTTTSEGPVVVEADPAPIKIEPDEPGGSTVPNQDRAVFDAASGTQAPNQQELVTTSEEPVDIATAPGEALPSSVGVKSDERLVPGIEDTSAQTPAASPTTVSPRRVRTLIVRPDGTLVEQPAPEPQAEVAAAPAPAPVVVPTIEATPAPAAETAAAPVIAPEAPAARPEATPAPTATATATPAPAAAPAQTANPPIVADRPADQPVTIVNQAPAQVAAAPQPAPTPQIQSGESAFSVQIASVPSRDGAQAQATSLQQRFPNLLGGRGISIQQAEIEGRGTFYRVRVAAQSRSDANSLCENYKRAGGSCFVTR